MSEGVIWDSYGRAWTADQFALSEAARMLDLEAFVDVMRHHYRIDDPERLMLLMEMRARGPKAHPEGADVDPA